MGHDPTPEPEPTPPPSPAESPAPIEQWAPRFDVESVRGSGGWNIEYRSRR
jgi:hypothetical protein